MRRGVSLVEVMIAFGILGLAIVPILTLFTGAGEQARQTADFGLALALLTKVDEDLRVSNWEDTHLPDRVETDSAFAPVASPVVQGQSPFFESLEDSAAPFGRIHRVEDPGITPDHAALYRELSTYRLTVSSQARSLPVTGRVVDINTALDWTDFRNRPADFPMGLTLGRFDDAADPPDSFADRVGADAAIMTTLFPQATGTLAQFATAQNVDVALLRRVGDLAVISGAAVATAAGFGTETANAAALVTGAPLAALRARIALARVHESHAATELQIIGYLGPILTDLAANYRPGALGGAGPLAPVAVALLRAGCANVTQQYDAELDSTVQTYFQCLSDPATGQLEPRLVTRLVMKLSEVLKLQVITGHPDRLALYQSVLKFLKDHQEGRNENFYNFANYELTNFTTVDAIRAAYAAPVRYQCWVQFHANVAAAIDALAGG